MKKVRYVYGNKGIYTWGEIMEIMHTFKKTVSSSTGIDGQELLVNRANQTLARKGVNNLWSVEPGLFPHFMY